ncbi:MAG: hypothetical protein IJK84_03950 [Bacteroidales bacterium]|nr:hypothetical protein [Bacteroidales bacterium]
MPESPNDIDRQIDFARLFTRKDRPLPKRGCSWAFFIFLGLLTLAVLVAYLFYSKSVS